jgi:hypothetical protein
VTPVLTGRETRHDCTFLAFVPVCSSRLSIAMEGQMSDGLWVQGTAFPDGECFGCGPRNPIGFRLRSLVRGGGVMAEWTAQPHHAANAGVLCGGVIGTLLDCHTGAAVWWWVNQRHGQWPGEEVAPGALCDGDVVYIEPNEEHWHGATAERSWPTSPSRRQTRAARSSPGVNTSPTTSTERSDDERRHSRFRRNGRIHHRRGKRHRPRHRHAFADQGTHLIAADRYADDDNHATVDLITSQHGSAIAATCDVTNSDDTQAALQQGVDTFGRLDIAFNNAGVELRPTPAADISEADWNRVRDHPIFCVTGA